MADDSRPTGGAAMPDDTVMDDATQKFFCAAVIEYLSMCKRDIFPIF